jgi:hypothetical protein
MILKIKEPIMSDIEILKEKNPSVAEFVESWRRKYQRGYDFSRVEDQAIFYEGMLELGRHIPLHSGTASLSVHANTCGVGQVEVHAHPKMTPASE